MSSDVLAVRPSNPVLAWGTALGVVGLAAAGFWLSFQALRDLAVRSGIDPELSFLWPLIVDGFIVVATAAAFGLKRRGRRVTWYPWAALILFAGLSVAGNAAHAVNVETVSVPVWVATVVSSVPAVALLIASHLLIVLVDGKARPVKRDRARQQRTKLASVAQPSAPVVQADAAPVLTVVPSPQGVSEKELVRRLEEIVESTGRPVTAAMIADIEGVSERTGRRRLEKLRATAPHLVEVPA